MKKIIIKLLLISAFLSYAGFAAAAENEQPLEIKEMSFNNDKQNLSLNIELSITNVSDFEIPDLGWMFSLNAVPRFNELEEVYVRQPIVEYSLLDKTKFFSLAPGESKDIKLSLGYSSFLPGGQYELQVAFIDKNSNFFDSHVKIIDLDQSGNYLNFSNCQVTRDGIVFAPEAGANVDAGSIFDFTCDVNGLENFSGSKIFYPEVSIRELNLFDYSNGDYFIKNELDSIDFSSDNKLSIKITAVQQPRAYQGAIRLLSGDERSPVTAFQTFRYVVRGEGARISSLFLDKTYYQKGDQALVNYEFFVSPDLYWSTRIEDSRRENGTALNANLKFSIFSDVGYKPLLCGEALKETGDMQFVSSISGSISVDIKKTCKNPKIVFSIENDGAVLSSYQYTLETLGKDLLAEADNSIIFIIIIGAVIILGLIFFLWNKSKRPQLPVALVVISLVTISLVYHYSNNINLAQARKQYEGNSMLHVHQNEDNFVVMKKLKKSSGDLNLPHNDDLSGKQFEFSYDTVDNSCSNNDADMFVRYGWFLRDKDSKLIKDRVIEKTIQEKSKDNGYSKTVTHSFKPSKSVSLKISKAPYRMIWDYRVAMFGEVSSYSYNLSTSTNLAFRIPIPDEFDWRIYPARATDKKVTGGDGFYYLESDSTFNNEEKDKAFENAYDITKPDFTTGENVTDNRCKSCVRDPKVRDPGYSSLRSIFPLTQEWKINVYTVLTVKIKKYDDFYDVGGTVTAKNINEINCGDICTHRYTNAKEVKDVTLTATPNANSEFAYWDGDCQGSETTCVVNTGQNIDVKAHFELKRPSLSVTVSGNCSASRAVSVPSTDTTKAFTCSSGTCTKDNYLYSDTLEITQSSNYPCVFSGWSGACSGAGNCSLIMNSAKTITATFNQNALSCIANPTISPDLTNFTECDGYGMDLTQSREDSLVNPGNCDALGSVEGDICELECLYGPVEQDINGFDTCPDSMVPSTKCFDNAGDPYSPGEKRYNECVYSPLPVNNVDTCYTSDICGAGASWGACSLDYCNCDTGYEWDNISRTCNTIIDPNVCTNDNGINTNHTASCEQSGSGVDSLVNSPNDCDSSGSCEYYCVKGYKLNSDGSKCIIKSWWWEIVPKLYQSVTNAFSSVVQALIQ